MKVKSERRWVIADAERGQVSIPQSWTAALSAANATPSPAGGRYLAGLLQLVKLVQTLQETHQAKEQAHVFRATTDPAANRANAANAHGLATSAGSTPSTTDRAAGDLAATTPPTDAHPSAATSGGVA